MGKCTICGKSTGFMMSMCDSCIAESEQRQKEGARAAAASADASAYSTTVSASQHKAFAALNAYAQTLVGLGWLTIAFAAVLAVVSLALNADASTKLIGFFAAVLSAVSGLGLIAAAQLMLCVRAIQADTHRIAMALAGTSPGAS